MAMEPIVVDVYLDVYDHDTTPTTIKTIALDSQTRYVRAYLQRRGEVYQPDLNATVKLIALRPDKTGVEGTGSVVELVSASGDDAAIYGLTAEITQAMLAIKGSVLFQFKMEVGTEALRTEVFKANNGRALDGEASSWADEYQGYNLDEFAERIASVESIAEDIGDLREDLNDTIERLDQLDDGGMTEEAKQALLTLVSHIGLWDDDHGQDYIDALEAALYPSASLTHITAVYTQTGDVYTDTSLDSLRSDLVVTAHYSDSTSETISAYTLSGTLTEGTSTVTVSYGGKTATFSVTVIGRLLPSGYQQLEYIYNENDAYFESAVSPRTYPIRIETGIYKESQASTEQAIICKKIGSSSSLEVGYNATSNTLFAYSGASAKVTDPVVYGNVIDVVAEFNSASPYKTLSVTANGETVSAQNTDANNTNILNTNNLMLFGNGSSLRFIGRMYYCRVYSDGELIGNFIPCYDKETGYAGLYETVGGTFHYSRGSRGFKRGGEV